MIEDFTRLDRSCSFVVSIERLTLEDVRTAKAAEGGQLLHQVFSSEGTPSVPFEVLDHEFTLVAKEQAARSAESKRKGRASSTPLEYQIAVSGSRRLMQCLSNNIYPIRIQTANYELSYFAQVGELTLTSMPSNTFFYSLGQVYQPLPILGLQTASLLDWNWSRAPTDSGLSKIAIESPGNLLNRYTISMGPGDNTLPVACWLRMSENPDSIIFSAYSYATRGSDKLPIPARTVTMQKSEGRLDAERLTIKDFDGDIAEKDIQMWIPEPKRILDLRFGKQKQLASINDLPEESRVLIVIERPK